MFKRIFVAGIHGVGKTTYCNNLENRLNIKAYSSSDLIYNFRSKSTKNKKVEDVKKNQDILIESIRDIGIDHFILDGHFILINKYNNFSNVPTSTFEKLNLDKIIILIGDICKIQKRLQNRDNKKYDYYFLEKMQIMEVNRAEEISEKLNIPLEKIKVN